MPAVSVAQRRLMGMAYCLKKGDCKKSEMSKEVIELADSMSLKELEKYAKTKEDNLPDKKESKLMNFKEFINENKKQLFKDLDIDDEFHLGKSKGSGFHKEVTMYIIYRKISKSKAICIEQIGYGNQRQVGSIKPMSPNALIYPIEKETI